MSFVFRIHKRLKKEEEKAIVHKKESRIFKKVLTISPMFQKSYKTSILDFAAWSNICSSYRFLFPFIYNAET